MKKFLSLLLLPMLTLGSVLLVQPAPAADLSITAANVVYSTRAVLRDGKAGVAISAGQILYKDTADGLLKLADANGASALIRTPIGMAANSAGAGQAVKYIISDPDLTSGATVSNGAVYILSATAGGLAPVADGTTGWYPCVLAVGIGSNKLAFDVNGLRSATAL